MKFIKSSILFVLFIVSGLCGGPFDEITEKNGVRFISIKSDFESRTFQSYFEKYLGKVVRREKGQGGSSTDWLYWIETNDEKLVVKILLSGCDAQTNRVLEVQEYFERKGCKDLISPCHTVFRFEPDQKPKRTVEIFKNFGRSCFHLLEDNHGSKGLGEFLGNLYKNRNFLYHGDLSLSNIIYRKLGEEYQFKLIDLETCYCDTDSEKNKLSKKKAFEADVLQRFCIFSMFDSIQNINYNATLKLSQFFDLVFEGIKKTNPGAYHSLKPSAQDLLNVFSDDGKKRLYFERKIWKLPVLDAVKDSYLKDVKKTRKILRLIVLLLTTQCGNTFEGLVVPWGRDSISSPISSDQLGKRSRPPSVEKLKTPTDKESIPKKQLKQE